jgi:hypothetical protein
MSSTTTVTATATAATQTGALTGADILRLFPEVNPALIGAGPVAASGDDALAGYDEEQVRLMDEVCIVVDADDKPVGSASKKTCSSPFLYIDCLPFASHAGWPRVPREGGVRLHPAVTLVVAFAAGR